MCNETKIYFPEIKFKPNIFTTIRITQNYIEIKKLTSKEIITFDRILETKLEENILTIRTQNSIKKINLPKNKLLIENIKTFIHVIQKFK